MALKCSEKLAKLKEALRETGGCAVAYSGGVDSSLVLAVAGEVLPERHVAVIATSSTYARRECDEAIRWAKSQNIPYVTVESEELDIPDFADNPPDRCYHCKTELFAKVRKCALDRGLEWVADGTNVNDADDFRPGMRAAQEMGVLSPLKEAGLTKEEIRLIAREVYNLPMWDKPAMACMASRFPYGARITSGKLRQVEEVENFLHEQGFRIYRARHHGELLRLELGPEDMSAMQRPGVREACVEFAKSQGFTYITMDLEGFRSGSMNEALKLPKRECQRSSG